MLRPSLQPDEIRQGYIERGRAARAKAKAKAAADLEQHGGADHLIDKALRVTEEDWVRLWTQFPPALHRLLEGIGATVEVERQNGRLRLDERGREL